MLESLAQTREATIPGARTTTSRALQPMKAAPISIYFATATRMSSQRFLQTGLTLLGRPAGVSSRPASGVGGMGSSVPASRDRDP